MLKLLDNLWAKFFALLIGLLIWFHVATEKTYNYEVRLPMTRVDLKENLILANSPTDTVTATVSATGKQLLREQWQTQGVRLSAISYPTGEHQISLTPSNLFLVSSAANIKIHEVVSPQSVTLDIDNQFVARLPIKPVLEAVADNGFAVARQIDLNPDVVTVVGPRTLVKELKALTTESRTLSGLRTDAVIKLPIIRPPGGTVRISPDSVSVTVHVVPVKTRTYDNLPIVIFNAPTGKTVKADPATVRVDLAGSPEDIDLLNRNALTVSVDYRQIGAGHIARLKVDCPSSFRVARLTPDSVRIVEEP